MTQATGVFLTGGPTAALPTQQRQRRGVLAPVIGLVALGVCGLVVLGLVGTSVGLGGIVVGALCALLPVGPVVAAFLWIDRWEPEPPRLLLIAFLWGACFSALGALIINSSAALAVDVLLGRGSGDVIGSTLIAPVVEEGLKGAFLVGLLLFRRREFDGIIDGIVYAGIVAAGFALTENILYFGRAFGEEAEMGGSVLFTLILRGVLSPFAHPLFTSMIGIGAGIAASSRNAAARPFYVLGGYALAVILHALWNSSASLFDGGTFLLVYGFVMVPLFAAMVTIVIWQRRREQAVIAEQLPGFAQAGWIAPSEIQLLSSLAGRRGWRAAVRQRSGRAVEQAVVRYQEAVTDLAFLRDRIAKGAIGPMARQWHDEAVAEVIRTRRKAVGHPEALTVALRHHGGGAGGWIPPPPVPASPRQPFPPGLPPQSWPHR
jgi:protease PrsW